MDVVNSWKGYSLPSRPATAFKIAQASGIFVSKCAIQVVSMPVFALGSHLFKRMEKKFADVI
jgi:hypothetical protein